LGKHLTHKLIVLFDNVGPRACLWTQQDLAVNAPAFNDIRRWLVDMDWHYSVASRWLVSAIHKSVGA